MPTLTGHSQRTDNSIKTKEYIRPMPATWFLHNRYLVRYAVRELTSVFVAGYAIFLMVLLARQNQGRQAFGIFFRSVLESPLSLVLHLIVLAFVGLFDLAMRTTAIGTQPVVENSAFGHDPQIPSETTVPLPMRKPEKAYKVPNGKGANAVTQKRMAQQKSARPKPMR